MASDRSLMNIANRRSPMADPCGTPLETGSQFDFSSFHDYLLSSVPLETLYPALQTCFDTVTCQQLVQIIVIYFVKGLGKVQKK